MAGAIAGITQRPQRRRRQASGEHCQYRCTLYPGSPGSGRGHCRHAPGSGRASEDNARSFDVTLDPEDHAKIEAILAKSRDLYQVIGDCGDEYRR